MSYHYYKYEFVGQDSGADRSKFNQVLRSLTYGIGRTRDTGMHEPVVSWFNSAMNSRALHQINDRLD